MSNPVWKAEQTIWNAAAKALGWEWEPAYDGFVRANHHPNGPAHQASSYPSELDAESACMVDGIETLDQARAVIEEKAEEKA